MSPPRDLFAEQISEPVGRDLLSEVEAKPEWSDLPGNIPGSAIEAAKDLVYPVLHPIQTAKGIYNVATDSKTRSAVGDFYKERYGGLENLHDTLIKDPVGIVADLAGVLTGGGAAAAKMAGAAGKVGKIAGKIGTAIDPVVAAGKAISGAAAGTSWLGKHALGITTLQGAKPIEQAFEAGLKGDRAFTDNMRGNVPTEAVLDDLTEGINKLKRDAQVEYRQNFPQSATPIDSVPVQTAYDTFVASLKTPNGKWKIDAPEQKRIEEMGDILKDYGAGSALDVFELDGLKQRLRSMYPDGTKEVQLQRGIASITDSIRGTINGALPEYGQVMGKYADAAEQLDDIRKTLSQNRNASVDTKLAKLRGTMNDTAKGDRALGMVEDIEAASGKPIASAVAGQQLSSWTPARGRPLVQGVGAGAAGAAGIFNPWMLPLAASSSPRLVGEFTHALGAGARNIGRAVPSQDARRAASRASIQLSRPIDDTDAYEDPPIDLLDIRASRAGALAK